MQIIARNKKVLYEYEIISRLNAGMVLSSHDISSIRRGGQCSISESYISNINDELFIFNMYIERLFGTSDSRMHRKILLQKREIRKIIGQSRVKSYTIVVIDVFFNSKGFLKSTIALAKGRRIHDKRRYKKEKEWKRERENLQK